MVHLYWIAFLGSSNRMVRKTTVRGAISPSLIKLGCESSRFSKFEPMFSIARLTLPNLQRSTTVLTRAIISFVLALPCDHKGIMTINARTKMLVLSLTLVMAMPTPAPSSSAPANGTIVQIVRAGQSTPDATAAFTPAIELLGFNNRGQVAFRSSHTGMTGAALNSRIYVGSPDNLTEIVRVGQPAPDRNGVFSSLTQRPNDPQCVIRFWTIFAQSSLLSINSNGQMAFLGLLSGTNSGAQDNTGIFLRGASSIVQIARSGQSVPDGSGVFSGFGLPVVNSNGSVAFAASVLGLGGRPTNCTMGIFLAKDTSLIPIARSNISASVGTQLITGLGDWTFNNKDQFAFVGNLTLEQPNSVLYLAKGNSWIEIARAGQPAPDGNGQFLSFSHPVLNDEGQVVFRSVLTGTKGGTHDNIGIFLAKSGRLLQIVRSGMPAPDGNGTLAGVNFPRLNNAGQVTFEASYTGTSGGGRDNTAIFMYADGRGLKQLVRAGPRAQDGNGRLAAVGRSRINGQGQVAFEATFIETREGANDNTGILLADGDNIVGIVRAGQPVPDGNGKFSAVGPSFLNDAGQIAFYGALRGTTQDEYNYSGIYIWSPVLKK